MKNTKLLLINTEGRDQRAADVRPHAPWSVQSSRRPQFIAMVSPIHRLALVAQGHKKQFLAMFTGSAGPAGGSVEVWWKQKPLLSRNVTLAQSQRRDAHANRDKARLFLTSFVFCSASHGREAHQYRMRGAMKTRGLRCWNCKVGSRQEPSTEMSSNCEHQINQINP